MAEGILRGPRCEPISCVVIPMDVHNGGAVGLRGSTTFTIGQLGDEARRDRPTGASKKRGGPRRRKPRVLRGGRVRVNRRPVRTTMAERVLPKWLPTVTHG